MGLFYKYQCKKCGKMYVSLPVLCHNCNTELSFICPLDMYIPQIAKYRPTKDCEEIHLFIFRSKKRKIMELEEKISHLESDFSLSKKIIGELKCEKTRTENELRRENTIIQSELRKAQNKILQLERLVQHYEQNQFRATSIPQGTMQAVKYAMTHAHPDNGGNAEDFVKFRKVYEELTRKRG